MGKHNHQLLMTLLALTLPMTMAAANGMVPLSDSSVAGQSMQRMPHTTEFFANSPITTAEEMKGDVGTGRIYIGAGIGGQPPATNGIIIEGHAGERTTTQGLGIFKSAGGLKTETEVFEYQEGGKNDGHIQKGNTGVGLRDTSGIGSESERAGYMKMESGQGALGDGSVKPGGGNSDADTHGMGWDVKPGGGSDADTKGFSWGNHGIKGQSGQAALDGIKGESGQANLGDGSVKPGGGSDADTHGMGWDVNHVIKGQSGHAAVNGDGIKGFSGIGEQKIGGVGGTVELGPKQDDPGPPPSPDGLGGYKEHSGISSFGSGGAVQLGPKQDDPGPPPSPDGFGAEKQHTGIGTGGGMLEIGPKQDDPVGPPPPSAIGGIKMQTGGSQVMLNPQPLPPGGDTMHKDGTGIGNVLLLNGVKGESGVGKVYLPGGAPGGLPAGPQGTGLGGVPAVQKNTMPAIQGYGLKPMGGGGGSALGNGQFPGGFDPNTAAKIKLGGGGGAEIKLMGADHKAASDASAGRQGSKGVNVPLLKLTGEASHGTGGGGGAGIKMMGSGGGGGAGIKLNTGGADAATLNFTRKAGDAAHGAGGGGGAGIKMPTGGAFDHKMNNGGAMPNTGGSKGVLIGL